MTTISLFKLKLKYIQKKTRWIDLNIKVGLRNSFIVHLFVFQKLNHQTKCVPHLYKAKMKFAPGNHLKNFCIKSICNFAYHMKDYICKHVICIVKFIKGESYTTSIIAKNSQ